MVAMHVMRVLSAKMISVGSLKYWLCLLFCCYSDSSGGEQAGVQERDGPAGWGHTSHVHSTPTPSLHHW